MQRLAFVESGCDFNADLDQFPGAEIIPLPLDEEEIDMKLLGEAGRVSFKWSGEVCHQKPL
jgi:hypothetical protein